MRILFITPVVPTETDGRRPFNYLKYLSNRHEVHLIAMRLPEQTPCDIRRLQDMGVRITTIEIVPVHSWINSVLGLFKFDPIRVSWCRTGEVRSAIERTLSSHFDIVHLDRMRMGQYAPLIHYPTVIDFTDSLVLYLERSLQYRRRILEKWIDRWERATIPRFERKVLKHVDAAIVCSSIDASVLKKYHPEHEFEVIENGVDLQQFRPKSHDPDHQTRCVITGTLFYFPNIDSVLFYKNEILPLIRSKFPGMETLIIGTRPVHKITKMDGRNGITLLANVPRMQEYLYQDDIYLCPLRVAAGIRNKLLEAMASGMPIVTTQLGAEGLELKHEREVLFAETPEEFVTQIERLIHSPELRHTIGQNARKYVKERHRYDMLSAQLENLYKRIIEK